MSEMQAEQRNCSAYYRAVSVDFGSYVEHLSRLEELQLSTESIIKIELFNFRPLAEKDMRLSVAITKKVGLLTRGKEIRTGNFLADL